MMCRSAIKDRQNIPVGESLEVSARVHLGAVDPQHVRVEAYHGEAENGGIKNPGITILNQAGQNGDGTYVYEVSPRERKRRLRLQYAGRPNPSPFTAGSRAPPHHLVVTKHRALSIEHRALSIEY